MTLNPTDLDDALMLCAAHRYCLGRQTYMVSVCIDRLRHHWPNITLCDRRDIVRETIDALLDHRVGDERIDAPAWREFARWGWATVSPAKQELIERQLAWKLQGRTVEQVLAEPAVTTSSGAS